MLTERRRSQFRKSSAAWRARNPDKVRSANKSPASIGRLKRWAANNPGKGAEYSKRYRAKNPDKIKVANARRRKSKPWLFAHHAMLRKARLLRATPPWGNLAEIKAFYRWAPDGHHVDHVIPLVHPLVCGLHVPANLQYLPAADNLRKRNEWHP